MENKPYLIRRILAALVDYSLIFALSYAYAYFFGEPKDGGGYSISGIHAFVPIVFWGILTIGIEQWVGATIGNAIFGLKPTSLIQPDGKLSISQSVKRHLLDIIDMSFMGIVGIIAIMNTEKHQRLGDLWAKTIVSKATGS